jgi:hypothetical protein
MWEDESVQEGIFNLDTRWKLVVSFRSRHSSQRQKELPPPHPPAASTPQDTGCTPCLVQILWRGEKFSCLRQHSRGDPPVALLLFHQSYIGSLTLRGKYRLLIWELRFPQWRRCGLLCYDSRVWYVFTNFWGSILFPSSGRKVAQGVCLPNFRTAHLTTWTQNLEANSLHEVLT